jgi:hypothetical protein
MIFFFGGNCSAATNYIKIHLKSIGYDSTTVVCKREKAGFH